jgi:hypothetical protein
MKKCISLAIMAVMFAAAAPLIAQTTDVSGQWDVSFEVEGDSISRVYTFEQAGEKLVVKWTRRNGESEQAEGTVRENKIEWTEIGKINDSEVRIIWTGMIEGNTMSGDVDFGGQDEFSWKAVKKS